MRRTLLLLTTLSCSLGCTSTLDAPSAPQTEVWTHAEPGAPEPGALLPSPDLDGKAARRMTVDQLRRSIPALFDGITWTIQTRAGAVNGFDALASTLGEADYIRTTQSNLDPSPLFAKFMDDMAASVCRQAIERDRAGAEPKLIVAHEDVKANLRFLRLKLHAVHVPEGESAGLEDLEALYETIHARSGDPEQAWWGVCIAMLTAPEMLAY